MMIEPWKHFSLRGKADLPHPLNLVLYFGLPQNKSSVLDYLCPFGSGNPSLEQNSRDSRLLHLVAYRQPLKLTGARDGSCGKRRSYHELRHSSCEMLLETMIACGRVSNRDVVSPAISILLLLLLEVLPCPRKLTNASFWVCVWVFDASFEESECRPKTHIRNSHQQNSHASFLSQNWKLARRRKYWIPTWIIFWKLTHTDFSHHIARTQKWWPDAMWLF